MAREISIAFDLPSTEQVEQLSELLTNVPDVQVVGSLNGSDLEISPQVVFTGGEGLLSRLEALKRRLPDVDLFAVSEDQSTENIVAAMQAGAAEFVPEPMRLEMLVAAFERVRTKMLGEVPRAEGKVISFVSSKGGVGATVIAVNTAVAMSARDNCRVALIDLSLHAGDSSVLLDMLPPTTMTDVCRNLHRLDYTLLEDAFAKHDSGVSYLPAPRNPEDVGEVTGEQVLKVLEMAKGLFDYILVDCASMGVEECSREAFSISERIFVLTDLSVSAVRNAARL
jgi:pilus assembly protein CpaE